MLLLAASWTLQRTVPPSKVLPGSCMCSVRHSLLLSCLAVMLCSRFHMDADAFADAAESFMMKKRLAVLSKQDVDKIWEVCIAINRCAVLLTLACAGQGQVVIFAGLYC